MVLPHLGRRLSLPNTHHSVDRTENMRAFIAIALTGCINIESEKRHDTGVIHAVEDITETPFVDDCAEAENDVVADASGVPRATQTEGIELCDDDLDFYRIEITPGTWLSLSMLIDGSGHNGTDRTDLDLWEINRTDAPIDVSLDRYDTDLDDVDVIWSSAAHSPLERLAWFNPTDEVIDRLVMVNGFDGAEGSYTLSTHESEWSSGDCDASCNDLMLFPQAFDEDDGYVLTQWTQYSHTRRAVAARIQATTRAVAEGYTGTAPLGLGDMSQHDADTPGLLEGVLRHPAGTHQDGNDIDVAYYQTGGNNLGRAVCENDGFFCTSPPSLLEPERTAFFIATLLADPKVTLVAVDPMIEDMVNEAAGVLPSADGERLRNGMVSGSEWPGRTTHMHIGFNPESSHPIED
jgi:hypothetical protein